MLPQSLQAAELLLERQFKEALSQGPDLTILIQSTAAALSDLSGTLVTTTPTDILEQIESLAEEPHGKRAATLFLVRCLAVPGVLRDNDKTGSQHAFRKIVSLVEQTAPDIAELANLEEKNKPSIKLRHSETFIVDA
jgi:hypothetical protein